jgi:pimeloyl-ACP methyl ester carboxylesterase
MPYATHQGVRIYWEEHGSGPPVLLIMGLSFTHEMWYRILPGLARQYRVILLDNRGIGRSDVPPGPYTIRQMAGDAAAVLDAAEITSANVIGASMGGMIAQELALCYPARVQSLLLGCTSHGGILAHWPRFSRLGGLPTSVAGRDRELLLIPLLYAASTPRERVLEDIDVQCRCACTRRGCLNQFAGILLWSSFLRLPRISVPTLVAHGAEDCLIPPQNGRVLAARIPGARFQLIPKAGHILMTDQPEICLDLSLDFLERHGNPEQNIGAGSRGQVISPASAA